MFMAVTGFLDGGDRIERCPDFGKERRDPASPFLQPIGVKHPLFQEIVEYGALAIDDKAHASGYLPAVALHKLPCRQCRYLKRSFLIFHSFHLRLSYHEMTELFTKKGKAMV